MIVTFYPQNALSLPYEYAYDETDATTATAAHTTGGYTVDIVTAGGIAGAEPS